MALSLERDRTGGGATAFADLNQLLIELVDGVRNVLGDTFCGAYLQGSFAVGDADAHSDVDFIVVTKDDVASKQQAELQALHQRLYALTTPWAQHLEGSYIPQKVLRRPDPDRRPLLYLDNGATEFAFDNHDNTAVVRWSLREHGVVLAGPDPRELVDPITPDELRADVRWALAEWAEWFRSSDSISRRGLAVAVLSHCRILHTLTPVWWPRSASRVSGRSKSSTRSGDRLSVGHSTTDPIPGRRWASLLTPAAYRARSRSLAMPPNGLPSTETLT